MVPPVGQRIAGIEVHPDEFGIPRAQLVFICGGRLAADVLEDEQGLATPGI